MPIRDSWRRRGHAPECWRIHSSCALRAALDLARTREAQARGQAMMFGEAIKKLEDDLETPDVLEFARTVLKAYHAEMKRTARRES